MQNLTVTSDELEAIARRLGARRFPGVTSSLYDELPARHHRLLTDRLLAALTARGLVAVHNDRLVAAPEVAVLLGPSLHGSTYYQVRREDDDGISTSAVGETNGAVIWHRAEDSLHRFDPLRTDGDLALALLDLIDIRASEPGDGGRVFRRRRSQLAAAAERPELVPPGFAEAVDRWRSITTISRYAAPDGAIAMGWLTVLDACPDRVWLIEPDQGSPEDGLLDGDDPLYAVTPLDSESLRRRLTAWVGEPFPSADWRS